jgi:hypothetical protein
MRRGWAVLVAAVVFLSWPAAAQTVDDVINKNIAAKGGLDKIKAVQTVRITGRVEIGQGMEAPFTLEMKRPMQMRIDIVIQGISATPQAYDGKVGWQLLPFEGSKDAQPLSADDLKDAEEQADIDGPLVDYKAKGNQVELMGKEDVEGSPCYKLKLTLKNGDVIYDYLDADSYLEVKQENKRVVNGTEKEFEQSIGDYKPVEGLMFPFAIENGVKGSQQRQKIIVEKVELNVPIESARFTMPAPKPADTKPGEVKPADPKPPMILMR